MFLSNLTGKIFLFVVVGVLVVGFAIYQSVMLVKDIKCKKKSDNDNNDSKNQQ